MSNGNGHHWSKFSWRDHMADSALMDCSLAAKGFWVGLLALMFDGSPTGYLTINEKPASIRQMALAVRCGIPQATRCLAELEAAGVFSRTVSGTIYSRRMVRDAEASETAREWGKRGGNPTLNPPGGVNPPLKVKVKGKVNGGLKLESESELEEEPPPNPPRKRVGKRGAQGKPVYRNGFFQMIEDEGMSSDPVADFLKAAKGLPHGNA